MLVQDRFDRLVPARRGHHVPSLPHHRLGDERRHVVRGDRRLEVELLQDLGAVETAARELHLVRAAIAVRRRDVGPAADERSVAGPLDRFRRGQGQRAHRPAVERAEETDDDRALAVPAGDLERRLGALRPAVGVEDLLRHRAGGEVGEPLGQMDLVRIVEVGPGEVAQPADLLPHRAHDLGMGVPDRGHPDPGSEVEEPVAVDVRDPDPAPRLRDDRGGLGAGHEGVLVGGDDRLSLGARHRRLQQDPPLRRPGGRFGGGGRTGGGGLAHRNVTVPEWPRGR